MDKPSPATKGDKKAFKSENENRTLFKAEYASIEGGNSNDARSSASTSTPPKAFTVSRLLAQARPERPMIIVGIICLIFSSLLNLLAPAFIGAIIDSIAQADAAPGTPPPDNALYRFVASLGFGTSPRVILNVSAVILLVAFALSACLAGMRAYLFSLAGERVVARLRHQLFSHVMTFEVAFFDMARTGELLNRLSTDTTTLKDAVTVNVSMSLRWAGTVVLGIGYLFVISWKLTLVMLATVPLVAVAARIYGRKVQAISKRSQDALAAASDTAEESISHIRTVRSFGREAYQGDLYKSRIDTTFGLGATLARYFGLFLFFIQVAASVATLLVLWYGATLVFDGEMTSGILTSYLIYTLTVGMALAGLAGVFVQIMQAVGACQRIFELLDRAPGIPLTSGRRIDRIEGHIVFDNVRFAYPARPDVTVLNGIHLELRPGTITALVGPSGQGKSTIVALIERFYDVAPGDGRILIDSIDLRDLDLTDLHAQIGLISQEPVLFAASIRENLLYGVFDEPSQEAIDRACEMANAKQFIDSFPDKYETLVGERGVRLSGGQKQRIAIARAILLNPRILIADEATSSLDAESEHHVQQALDRLMQGRTVLIVAHRLSTVKSAHSVLVIQGGTVRERGTHDELLRLNGVYSRLVARQLQRHHDDSSSGERGIGSSALLPSFDLIEHDEQDIKKGP